MEQGTRAGFKVVLGQGKKVSFRNLYTVYMRLKYQHTVLYKRMRIKEMSCY